MRPVKLIMSAFGSYAGRTEIDFTEIPNGLFLLLQEIQVQVRLRSLMQSHMRCMTGPAAAPEMEI